MIQGVQEIRATSMWEMRSAGGDGSDDDDSSRSWRDFRIRRGFQIPGWDCCGVVPVIRDGLSRWRSRGDEDGGGDRTSGRLPSDIKISDTQFGHKWGKHAEDYGFDPQNRQAMNMYRNRINNVFENPDQVRQGPWHPGGGGWDDVLMYKQGDHLLLTQPDGTYITMFPDTGSPNTWWQDADIIQ